MSSLQVRELPEYIYSLLKRRAEAEHRSIAQEAIAFLTIGLDTSISSKVGRTKLLQKMAEEPGLSDGTVKKLDPVKLIHDDK